MMIFTHLTAWADVEFVTHFAQPSAHLSPASAEPKDVKSALPTRNPKHRGFTGNQTRQPKNELLPIRTQSNLCTADVRNLCVLCAFL